MALTSITKDFVIKAGALTEGTSFVTSSTGQTGTLQVNGGAAIAKNLIVGSTATIWGAQTNQSSLTVNGLTTVQGFSAQLTTATSLQVTGAGLFQGQTLFTGAVNTFSGAVFVTGTNILTVGTGATNLGGTLGVAGVTQFTNNTAATTGGAGAVQITGGEYIGGNLVVNSTNYSTSTGASNALYVAGGIYAAQGLTTAPNAPTLFNGPVTFNGSATYVLSTNSYYTDNMIELHLPPGGVGSQWTFDDGKDIGLRMHYYNRANSTDTNAALVLADDSQYLEFYNTGSENTNGTFTGTVTYGTFKTGSIILGRNQIIGSYANSVASISGEQLTVYGSGYFTATVTATTFVGALTGTSTYATNLMGGAPGSLPYQSAANVTAMLPIGTNGYILTVQGGNPAWANVSGLSAGLATTATNIAGGTNNQIPYQTAPGQTGFSSNLLFGANGFTTTNVFITSNNNSTGYNNGTGALQVTGGAAVSQDLWVGGNINLQGNLYLKGVGLDQITGTTGTFVNLLVTGTNGTVLAVSGNSTYAGTVGVTNSTGVYSTNSGALQVIGGVGVGGGMYVGGIFTASSANVIGNLTVGGVIISNGGISLNTGNFATNLGNNRVIYTNAAGTLTSVSSFTFDGSNLGVGGYITGSGGATLSALTVTNNLTVGGMIFSNGGFTMGTGTNIITNLGTNRVTYVNAAGTLTTVAGFTFDGANLAVPGLSSLNGGATISSLTVTNNLIVGGMIFSNGGFTMGTGTNIITNLGTNRVTYVNAAGTLTTVAGFTFDGANLAVPGYTSLNGGATLSAATVTNSLLVSGTETVTGLATFNGGANVSTTLTATNLVVTGSATLPGNISLTALTITNLTVTNNETIGNNLLVSNLFTATMAATFGSTISAGGVVSITNSTDSNATNNGALVVTGGVGIGKNLTVGTAVTVGTATTQTVVNSFYSNNTLLSSYTSGFIQTNSAINLDTFSALTYRTAKYLVQIVDGTKIHVEEILVFHDGTNVYMTEYAISTSQGELGTFDAGLASNTITLTFTANYTPTQMTIKMSRQTITL